VSDDRFTLTYDGDALKNGVMDVRELAPALLATGELIQTANRFLNGDRTQVSLQVKSDFRRGSFNIDLLLNQNLIEQAKQFLQLHPNIKDAKELLEILFFYGGLPAGVIGGGVSVFKFIKWLRGRSIASGQVTFINDGVINIQIGNDATMVSETVLKLSQEELIRKFAEGVVRPLKREGIDELQLDGGADRSEKVDKSEAVYFDAGFADGETIFENLREAVLEIVRLSFNPQHKWGLSDGTTKIRATINDHNFWSEVRSGLRFAKGDHILVRLRTRTFKNDAGDLRSEYSVEEVIKHLPRRDFRQMDL